MERLGILQIKNGSKQICNPIEVVSSIPFEAIRKDHKQNLQPASEKIETIAIDRREFQSISLPVVPEKTQKFKALIDQFLEDVAKTSQKDSGTEIYNMNVQFFTITIQKGDLK